MKKKHLLLLSLGVLVLSVSVIFDRYYPLTDFANGLFKGVALGLMLLSVWLGSRMRNKICKVAE